MEILDIAVKAAIAGGEIINRRYKARDFQTRSKPDSSFQTRADLESEKAIVDIIKAAYPAHNIYGEEGGRLVSTDSPYEWLIDPLDGTDNFVMGIGHFSVCITVCNSGEPITGVVYEPLSQTFYTAKRGQGALLNGKSITVSATTELKSAKIFFIPDFSTKRQLSVVRLRNAIYQDCRRLLDTWSPALDWCLVASGRADALFVLEHQSVKADIRSLILQEAGGRITDFQNRPFPTVRGEYIIASNGTHLHDALISVANELTPTSA